MNSFTGNVAGRGKLANSLINDFIVFSNLWASYLWTPKLDSERELHPWPPGYEIQLFILYKIYFVTWFATQNRSFRSQALYGVSHRCPEGFIRNSQDGNYYWRETGQRKYPPVDFCMIYIVLKPLIQKIPRDWNGN